MPEALLVDDWDGEEQYECSTRIDDLLRAIVYSEKEDKEENDATEMEVENEIGHGESPAFLAVAIPRGVGAIANPSLAHAHKTMRRLQAAKHTSRPPLLAIDLHNSVPMTTVKKLEALGWSELHRQLAARGLPDRGPTSELAKRLAVDDADCINRGLWMAGKFEASLDEELERLTFCRGVENRPSSLEGPSISYKAPSSRGAASPTCIAPGLHRSPWRF